jgi:hypothetical protein
LRKSCADRHVANGVTFPRSASEFKSVVSWSGVCSIQPGLSG